MLNENNLCSYYDLSSSPGLKAKGKFVTGAFAYLDDEKLVQQLVHFSNSRQINVTFSLPQMHCSSCVFLLENLHRIESGISTGRVNFQRKEIYISFDPNVISLRKVVELMAFIGYEPNITLNDADGSDKQVQKKLPVYKRKQLYKIGIAGFCFSNIMMLSFPEYFSSGEIGDGLKNLFPFINFILSLPVLLYCASDFFISAFKGIRQKYLNIDAPIALAIVVTFARSYYEIMIGNGNGYLDSGSGIVFFMLIGRWFQDKTYDSLAFDKDYKSYFPLGVTVIREHIVNGYLKRNETSIPVTELRTGDRIRIRNEEMIPADAILINGQANIDYSFVNGENAPEHKVIGEVIYAGGKQLGGALELKVVKNVSQSYISELWNNEIFTKKKQRHSFIHPWSRYFTLALFTVAFGAVIFWTFTDSSKIMTALTSVLIVACPCSLLLSDTFTNGNMLRIFSKNNLYLKNAFVIETLAAVTDLVFDKTGTITESNRSIVKYHGKELSAKEELMVAKMTSQSNHPLSKMIFNQFSHLDVPLPDLQHYNEVTGKGIMGTIDGNQIKIGSSVFTGSENTNLNGSNVTIEINGDKKGHFIIQNHYREGIDDTINALQKSGYRLHVLSGDNDTEKMPLARLFGKATTLKFRQLPLDKLEYIKTLQSKNRKVLMIGDGLNDAGALRQADAGIAVNEKSTQFTPACDAILEGSYVTHLHSFLSYAKAGKQIVTASFILSIIYNIAGLSFAVTAQLSPMIAAILMPASSISIVTLVTVLSSLRGKSL